MEGNERNRRIVPRAKAEGQVGWRPLAVTNWWARRKDRKTAGTASVEDISITGARLLVPVTSTLSVGVFAEVEVEGDTGSVEVRWIERLDDPTTARVGVEFRALSDALEERINSLVANGREETTDWRWEIAR